MRLVLAFRRGTPRRRKYSAPNQRAGRRDRELERPSWSPDESRAEAGADGKRRRESHSEVSPPPVHQMIVTDFTTFINCIFQTRSSTGFPTTCSPATSWPRCSTAPRRWPSLRKRFSIGLWLWEVTIRNIILIWLTETQILGKSTFWAWKNIQDIN